MSRASHGDSAEGHGLFGDRSSGVLENKQNESWTSLPYQSHLVQVKPLDLCALRDILVEPVTSFVR